MGVGNRGQAFEGEVRLNARWLLREAERQVDGGKDAARPGAYAALSSALSQMPAVSPLQPLHWVGAAASVLRMPLPGKRGCHVPCKLRAVRNAAISIVSVPQQVEMLSHRRGYSAGCADDICDCAAVRC